MKSLLFCISFLLVTLPLAAQTIEGCTKVYMRTTEEVRYATQCAEQLADFVLSRPVKEGSREVKHARKVVISWMNKSPDHMLYITEPILKIIKRLEGGLFAAFMASMVKGYIATEDKTGKSGLKIFANYLKDSNNKVALKKATKQFIADAENGELNKYLKD